MIAFSERLSGVPEMQGVLAKLTTPEQAAKMAKAAMPKLMVSAHIVTKDLPEPLASRDRHLDRPLQATPAVPSLYL